MNNEIKNKYPKTFKIILDAFSGESQARNKYDFFAKTARKEGHHKVADFFEETSRNEMQHAKLLFKLIGGLSDSKENLKVCIDDENHEQSLMYPNFAKIAKEEGFTKAEILFSQLAKIEKNHEERFRRLLLELEDNTLYSSKSDEKIAWICQVCGNIEYSTFAPKICPVCNHPQGHFERLENNY